MEGLIWIVIPTFHGDAHLAKDLLRWCHQLDGRVCHGCLIAVDAALDWSDASELLRLANEVFQRVEIITTEESWGSWPAGPNALFKCAAQFFESRKIAPWLWLEPDAIPLTKSWLDTIQAAYFAAGKPFMGCLTPSLGITDTVNYLPGCSVYPWNAWSVMGKAWDECKAFDMATAKATIPLAAHTEKIQHFWGRDFGDKHLAPTFKESKEPGDPVNTFTMANVRPEAVVFHANKDGTLARLLGCKEHVQSSLRLCLVFPFCWMDAKLMLSQLQWLYRFNGKIDRTAVLHFDSTVDNVTLGQIKAAARMVFKEVVLSHYRNSPRTGWPVACNWAFQHAVKFMAKMGTSWLWCEADCVAVKEDWIEQLESEYENGGKPFGGTIVGAWDGLQGGHANGVAIYPPNVAEYSRAVMTTIHQAWDTAMHDELGKAGLTAIFHKMNHLIQHCGAVVNGKCKPANGPNPSFGSQRDVDTIVERSTVLFHPAKEISLISRLTERL